MSDDFPTDEQEMASALHEIAVSAERIADALEEIAGLMTAPAKVIGLAALVNQNTYWAHHQYGSPTPPDAKLADELRAAIDALPKPEDETP